MGKGYGKLTKSTGYVRQVNKEQEKEWGGKKEVREKNKWSVIKKKRFWTLLVISQKANWGIICHLSDWQMWITLTILYVGEGV